MEKIPIPEQAFDIEDDRTDECAFFSHYEDDIYFYGEDNDNQDGSYFRAIDKCPEPTVPQYDIDVKLDTKKMRAVLYLHLHQELMSKKQYKDAYDKLRDDGVRSCAYWMEHKAVVGSITEADRDAENFVLDIQLNEYEVERVEKFKKDAIYIVRRIAAGKSIFTY